MFDSLEVEVLYPTVARKWRIELARGMGNGIDRYISM
jgi:hypothetical protein